jgi:hypothetical protein
MKLALFANVALLIANVRFFFPFIRTVAVNLLGVLYTEKNNENQLCSILYMTSFLRVRRHFRSRSGLNVHGADATIQWFYQSVKKLTKRKQQKQSVSLTSPSCMGFFWILKST